jgi:xyloglucan 6-xylosyltransferase
MERAFNFADNQVLRLYGFRHESLASSDVRRVTNRSANPLEAKEEALSFLRKPKDPVVQSHDVRKNRKRKGKRDSVLDRILKRLGWRSEF